MHYYYDVLANLDTVLWNFYEWEQKDNIIPIKKIPLVRISEKDLTTFLKYQVLFEKEWSQKYLEKTVVKNEREKLSCILFSSGKNAVILEIDEFGNTISRSKLLIEDENNCNEVVYAFGISTVPYKIENKLKKIDELRQATKEKHFIGIELKTLKERKNTSKCQYLYYEWFKELETDLDKMIQRMTKELKGEYSMKIHEIATLIKMSYKECL